MNLEKSDKETVSGGRVELGTISTTRDLLCDTRRLLEALSVATSDASIQVDYIASPGCFEEANTLVGRLNEISLSLSFVARACESQEQYFTEILVANCEAAQKSQ